MVLSDFYNAVHHGNFKFGMLSMCLEFYPSQVLQHSGDTARLPVSSSDKTRSPSSWICGSILLTHILAVV